MPYIMEEIILPIIVIFAIAMIPVGIYVSIVDGKEMEEQNCVKTSENREVIIPLTIMSGTTPVIIPTPVTEYLYTCDDKNRWRE